MLNIINLLHAPFYVGCCVSFTAQSHFGKEIFKCWYLGQWGAHSLAWNQEWKVGIQQPSSKVCRCLCVPCAYCCSVCTYMQCLHPLQANVLSSRRGDGGPSPRQSAGWPDVMETMQPAVLGPALHVRSRQGACVQDDVSHKQMIAVMNMM